jgi:hypothetical protein
VKYRWKEEALEAEDHSAANPERCTRQLALSAEKNAKSPSNQLKANLYTAGIASRNTENPGSKKLVTAFFER